MDETFPVYIGFDPRESEAYEVCRHSLIRHSSWPLCVIPLRQPMLRYIGLYRREFEERDGVRYDLIDGKPFSTEFSFTRFLTPALAQYQGWALFCDCDMMYRHDLRRLLNIRNDKYAVMVVKHAYAPPQPTKMDGQIQQKYYRKNWSSFILWNCGHPSNLNLTVEAVNTEPGSWLHGFGWLQDSEIGDLPEEWNYLVGWSPRELIEDPANVHFTSGGPWFEDYRNVEYAHEWRQEQALIENAQEVHQRRCTRKFVGA